MHLLQPGRLRRRQRLPRVPHAPPPSRLGRTGPRALVGGRLRQPAPLLRLRQGRGRARRGRRGELHQRRHARGQPRRGALQRPRPPRPALLQPAEMAARSCRGRDRPPQDRQPARQGQLRPAQAQVAPGKLPGRRRAQLQIPHPRRLCHTAPHGRVRHQPLPRKPHAHGRYPDRRLGL